MRAAVAVAVVSWNTRELLARCLRSLAADADAGLASVWVVDNGSTDGSPQMVAEEFPWARLELPGENLGFGRAVNRIAERTAEPWIAAANADLELEPGTLRRLVEAGDADPRAGALAPRLIMPSGETQHSVHSFPTIRLGLLFNSGLARVIPGMAQRLCLEDAWDPERRRAVEWAHGALLLLRRDAFEAVGGFDPAQWMYAEDIDIAWRLAAAGWPTLYEPTARVRHEVSAAARQAFAAERHQRHIAAAYEWMARRQSPGAARAYQRLNVAGAALRAAALALPARIAPGRFAARRRAHQRYRRLHRQGLDAASARRQGLP